MKINRLTVKSDKHPRCVKNYFFSLENIKVISKRRLEKDYYLMLT